ncbi:MAG: ergothioneine biosynthesis protein EgtB [Candidatus Dormibacteria bacterium]
MTAVSPGTVAVDKRGLAEQMLDARRRTELLLRPVDDDRLMTQHDPLLSPLVWDYGHIAAYEELWLVQRLSGRAPINEERMHLYDAFEKPRRVRGSLPLMTRPEVEAYRDRVDGLALELLDEADMDGADPLLRHGFVYEMIVQHEHQHQETILQALQMLPGGYRPDAALASQVAHSAPLPHAVTAASRPPAPSMVAVAGGRYPIGATGHGPHDNERPRHEVSLAAYRIDRFPVTCGDFAGFIADGGYRRAELWTDTGWAWRLESGAEAPLYWRREGDSCVTERFGESARIDWRTPVIHVCWYEADAYARWAGKRLPTEFEWEVAAGWDPALGRTRRFPWGDQPPTADLANLDHARLGCATAGAHPLGASALGCEQMVGDVWEWTSSDFLPYPGFTAFPYREYSEVFFGSDHRVLRGASCASRSSVARVTFRNWDYPIRRQIFAGFRCAADGDEP